MADDPSSDPNDVSNTPLSPHPPQLRPRSFRGGFGGPQGHSQHHHQLPPPHQPQSPMRYYPYTSDQMYTLPSPSTYPPSPAYSMVPSYGVPATSATYTYPTPGYAPWGYYPFIQSHLTSTQGAYPSSLDESPSSPNPGPPQSIPSPQPQSPYGPHSPGYSPLHHPNFSVPATGAPAYPYSTPAYAASRPIFPPQYGMNPNIQPPYHTGPHATSSFGSQPSETGQPTDDRTTSQPQGPLPSGQQSSQNAVQTPQQQHQQQAGTPSPGSWWFPPGYAVSYAYPGAPNADPYRQFQVPPHRAAPPVSSQAPLQSAQDPPPAPSRQARYSIGPPGAPALSPQVHRFPPLVSSPQFSPTSASASSSPFAVAPLPLRRFNPNPTARSEWVLWCGNVPNDATEEELLCFFRQVDSQPTPETALNVCEGVTPTDVALTASGGNNTLPAHPSRASSGSAATAPTSSVASVFLIARSNCAFINFTSEEALHKAVYQFNGKPLRKGGKCPRLVCRVRRREDDLRAGVGGQRGTGIHVGWVKEMAQRQQIAEAHKEVDDPPTSPSTHLGPESSASADDPSPPQGHPGEDQEPVKERPAPMPLQSGDSGKSQSTTSSLLVKHFPKRYFILKSLTQFDLNLSVQRGLWATQPHNEPVLDQAYRTSTVVYLIFGVNKSGEFFGYAKMDSRIFSDGQRPSVEWAARDRPGSTGTSPVASRLHPSAIVEDAQSEGVVPPARPPATPIPNPSSGEYLLTPEPDHPRVTSPDPITPGDVMNSAVSQPNPPGPSPLTNVERSAQHSAPAEMGRPYKRLSVSGTLQSAGTWDEARKQRLQVNAKREDTLEGIGEEPPPPKDDQEEGAGDEAPPGEKRPPLRRPQPLSVHTAPLPSTTAPLPGTTLADQGPDQRTFVDRVPVPPGDSAAGGGAAGGKVGWGTPFKVQWIRTDPLTFHRTKHIKNPWNNDREVKVSRDGTEIEPTVGQKLIDEWEKIEQSPRPNPVGETAKSSPPIAPLPRSAGGRHKIRSNDGTPVRHFHAPHDRVLYSRRQGKGPALSEGDLGQPFTTRLRRY